MVVVAVVVAVDIVIAHVLDVDVVEVVAIVDVVVVAIILIVAVVTIAMSDRRHFHPMPTFGQISSTRLAEPALRNSCQHVPEHL